MTSLSVCQHEASCDSSGDVYIPNSTTSGGVKSQLLYQPYVRCVSGV